MNHTLFLLLRQWTGTNISHLQRESWITLNAIIVISMGATSDNQLLQYLYETIIFSFAPILSSLKGDNVLEKRHTKDGAYHVTLTGACAMTNRSRRWTTDVCFSGGHFLCAQPWSLGPLLYLGLSNMLLILTCELYRMCWGVKKEQPTELRQFHQPNSRFFHRSNAMKGGYLK